MFPTGSVHSPVTEAVSSPGNSAQVTMGSGALEAGPAGNCVTWTGAQPLLRYMGPSSKATGQVCESGVLLRCDLFWVRSYPFSCACTGTCCAQVHIKREKRSWIAESYIAGTLEAGGGPRGLFVCNRQRQHTGPISLDNSPRSGCAHSTGT